MITNYNKFLLEKNKTSTKHKHKAKLSDEAKDFITKKIKFLIEEENRPQKQSIAMAYNYAKKEGLIKEMISEDEFEAPEFYGLPNPTIDKDVKDKKELNQQSEPESENSTIVKENIDELNVNNKILRLQEVVKKLVSISTLSFEEQNKILNYLIK